MPEATLWLLVLIFFQSYFHSKVNYQATYSDLTRVFLFWSYSSLIFIAYGTIRLLIQILLESYFLLLVLILLQSYFHCLGNYQATYSDLTTVLFPSLRGPNPTPYQSIPVSSKWQYEWKWALPRTPSVHDCPSVDRRPQTEHRSARIRSLPSRNDASIFTKPSFLNLT